MDIIEYVFTYSLGQSRLTDYRSMKYTKISISRVVQCEPSVRRTGQHKLKKKHKVSNPVHEISIGSPYFQEGSEILFKFYFAPFDCY